MENLSPYELYSSLSSDIKLYEGGVAVYICSSKRFILLLFKANISTAGDIFGIFIPSESCDVHPFVFRRQINTWFCFAKPSWDCQRDRLDMTVLSFTHIWGLHPAIFVWAFRVLHIFVSCSLFPMEQKSRLEPLRLKILTFPSYPAIILSHQTRGEIPGGFCLFDFALVHTPAERSFIAAVWRKQFIRQSVCLMLVWCYLWFHSLKRKQGGNA